MDDLIRRQAAIDLWEKYHPTIAVDAMQYDAELRKLPSAQPEYHFDEWCTECKEYDQERNCCPRFNQVIRTTLQEVQEERKKGKWILKPNIYGVAYCSECDYELHTDNTNYCPNCGSYNGGDDNVNE